MKYGFGIDLGGTTVKIAYFDETGTMLEKWEIPTVIADGGKQILPDIAASIRSFIEKNGIDGASILGIGIGVYLSFFSFVGLQCVDSLWLTSIANISLSILLKVCQTRISHAAYRLEKETKKLGST